jgi:hypothetical protein
MIKKHFWGLALLLYSAGNPFLIEAQTVLEGVVVDANGQVIQHPAKVSVFELPSQILRGETETRPDGHFVFELPAGKYHVLAVGDLFFEKHDTVTLGKEKAFLKMNVRRRPGYVLNGTLIEAPQSPGQTTEGISGASIEIYNHTKQKLDWSTKAAPEARFRFTFERGTHYTLLLRKKGYLAKRMEVYFHVGECIVCIDGVGELVSNASGELSANIELVREDWRPLTQIIAQENLEEKNLQQNTKSTRLKEANNSVPLPALTPNTTDFSPRGDEGVGAPPPRYFSDPSFARAGPGNGPDMGLKILHWPPNFRGYAIEIARSDAAFPNVHTVFRGQKEIFRMLEKDGKYAYLIANLGTENAAKAFFLQKIKPDNVGARLVHFTESGKEYLPE